MPVIVKLPSGNWRAQDRRKGRYVSGSFQRQRDAEEWALEAERSIDRGLTPRVVHVKDVKTFADIIDLHIGDLLEVRHWSRHRTSALAVCTERDRVAAQWTPTANKARAQLRRRACKTSGVT